MRPLLLALLLAAAPLLAGCAADPDAGAPVVSTPSGPGWSGGDGPYPAYHESPEEGYVNVTLLALREDGRALRVTYMPDQSGVPRLAPGIELPDAEVRALFEPEGLDRDAGGLVVLVEAGRVPEAQASAVLAALDHGMPASDAERSKHFSSETFVDLRAGRLARLTPGAAEGTLLREAFLAARQAFVAERRQEATPWDAPPLEGCARLSVEGVPPAVAVGETLRVRATVENCGDETLRLATTPCEGLPVLAVQVQAPWRGIGAILPVGEEPSPAYAVDGRCRGQADVLEVPPGESRVQWRAWNGAFAACRAEDACETLPPEPGRHDVFAYVQGAQEHGRAEVTLLPPDEPTMPFLLVKEQDWVNGTGDGHVQGYFGGHCAPAHYALDPPTLTLRFHDHDPEDPPDAFVLRDFREGAYPNRTVTFSADRVELVEARNGSATLASPFDREAVVANVEVEGDAFVVNGTRLEPGESTTLHASREVRADDESIVRTESVLVFTNVGRAHVLKEQVGGCA